MASSPSSQLAASLPACVPPALALSVVARAVAVAVDFLALVVLGPAAFASYLFVLLVVELLLAFFGVAPRLAAVRVLARATFVDASLDAVRLTVAVRRLWRRIERYVLVAGLVLLAALFVLADAGLGAVTSIGVAFLLFALRGRVELAAGLLAGILRPLAALFVSALAPHLVLLVLLVVLVLDGSPFSPAAVLLTHAFGVSIGLLVARFVLVAHGPAAAVGVDVAPAQPVPFRALCAWTGAALLDRAIPFLPLLAVLVFADPLDALAYAMAWRVSALLDAGLFVHAVVRPAVAVVTGSASGSVSADPPSTSAPSAGPSVPLGVASRAVSGALWWTLVLRS